MIQRFKSEKLHYKIVPVRQGNQRETSSQKGSDYSDVIIEFQDHRGYFLDTRSEDSGEKEDIVFIPKAGNRSRVIAEAKYRSHDKQGLSPNDFKADFAEWFYQWEEGAYRGYEFNLFLSNSANPQLWLDLFKRLKDDVVESFFDDMKKEADEPYQSFLEKHEASRFKRFLENSYIWIDYGIGDFERIIKRDKEDEEYGYDPYAINYEPVPETGIHKTNLLEVTVLPTELYRIPAVDGLTTGEFYSYDLHDILPIHYYENDIYSLLHPIEFDDKTTEMLSGGEHETISFQKFATEDPLESVVDISKVLIRGVVTVIADRIGAEVNRERYDTRVYMRHEDKDLKVQGKWVTQELETGEVRHRSITVFVKYFNGNYFLGLFPTNEFTKDGKELVSGGRKKHLSDRFSAAKFPQNDRKSNTVEMWLSELALEESLTRFNLPSNLRDIQLVRVDEIELEGIRPPKSGSERNELVKDQLAGAADLEDFE